MGSGKSTVSHQLRQMGFDVLDADQVAHQVLAIKSEGEAEVFRTFGQVVKDPMGGLDRRALGRLVFNDPAKLAQLEAIIHPRVKHAVAAARETLRLAGRGAAFYDVPLLFEKKMRDQFDAVLVVSAAKALRVARVQARSALTLEEIEERNSRHLPAEFKEAAASAVIRNEGTLAELRLEIERALRKIGVNLPTSA